MAITDTVLDRQKSIKVLEGELEALKKELKNYRKRTDQHIQAEIHEKEYSLELVKNQEKKNQKPVPKIIETVYEAPIDDGIPYEVDPLPEEEEF